MDSTGQQIIQQAFKVQVENVVLVSNELGTVFLRRTSLGHKIMSS